MPAFQNLRSVQGAVHFPHARYLKKGQSKTMKVLLAAIEGEAYFDSLNDLAIPGLDIVRTSSPDEVEREIVDADVIYGFPGAAALEKAAALKWIQSPGAGVDWVTRIPR